MQDFSTLIAGPWLLASGRGNAKNRKGPQWLALGMQSNSFRKEEGMRSRAQPARAMPVTFEGLELLHYHANSFLSPSPTHIPLLSLPLPNSDLHPITYLHILNDSRSFILHIHTSNYTHTCIQAHSYHN